MFEFLSSINLKNSYYEHKTYNLYIEYKKYLMKCTGFRISDPNV